MNVSAAASVDAAMSALPTNPLLNAGKTEMPPEEVARQFEAVLVRQMLSETMKPLLENGESGQVYGYFITEALAETFTKGGGFGLQSVLQAQLYDLKAREKAKAEAAAGAAMANPVPDPAAVQTVYKPGGRK
jgi:Rod binding domain-containing protein